MNRRVVTNQHKPVNHRITLTAWSVFPFLLLKCIISFVQSKVLSFALMFLMLNIKWSCVASIITHYFKFKLDRVRMESVQTRIRVGLGWGHLYSGWINLDMNRIYKISNQFRFSLGHFVFKVKSGQYSCESIQFWVSSLSAFGPRWAQLF